MLIAHWIGAIIRGEEEAKIFFVGSERRRRERPSVSAEREMSLAKKGGNIVHVQIIRLLQTGKTKK
jgi:hypothetical protein